MIRTDTLRDRIDRISQSRTVRSTRWLTATSKSPHLPDDTTPHDNLMLITFVSADGRREEWEPILRGKPLSSYPEFEGQASTKLSIGG